MYPETSPQVERIERRHRRPVSLDGGRAGGMIIIIIIIIMMMIITTITK